MQELLLGIDLGTSSTKGVLTTVDGAVVASTHRPHGMSLPRPGWAEVDAAAVWGGDLVSVARELTGLAGDADIVGVGVSGVGPCLLVCDDELHPLRAAILYGIDMRATAEIAELTERYGAERIIERGGTALSTQAVGPKLLWLRRHEPEVWAAARRWYNANSYAVARLTGEYVLDHHTASQCDPLYGIHERAWLDDWVDDIAPGLAMPRLVWPADVVGRVHAGAAAETGLREGTPVVAGTVDAWAEAFSAGVRRPGSLMLMYGSTMFFVEVLAELTSHPMLWTTSGVEPGTYTLAAGMATSGSLTGWIRDLTGGASYEVLVQEAAATPPGADGLLLLPYFAGERTPIFDADARGVVAGLTLRHGRGHLYRAACEGIAYGIRQILELLDSCAGTPQRLVAVGGGTQGGLWTQIVSDVTGRVQELPSQTIGASYGDALLAAIGTGRVAPDTDWATTAKVIEPNPDRRQTYDRLFADFSDLYPATAGIVHRLAAMQSDEPR